MKKLIPFLLLFVVLLLLSVYLFIPSKLVISKAAYIGAGQNTIYRSLTENELITKWWPDGVGQKQTLLTKDSGFKAGSSTFIIKKGLDIINIEIKHRDLLLNSLVNTIPLQKDSSIIEWRTELSTTSNPLNRVLLYWKAKQIKEDMDVVLYHFKKFVEKEENVYGLLIQRSKVTDTLLLSAKMQTAHYPTPSDYYSLIEKLKTYIASNNVQETNFPMLHIDKQDTGLYHIMVAIPINKRIQDHQNFIVKRMVAGNLLTAEVKGGTATINQALEKFDQFNADHQFNAPAISFQLLVTNRLQEQDTSKWITKLCFPVY